MNEIKEENTKAATVPIVPENSALMTNEKLYPKPQVPLKDAETSAQTKQKFEQLLKGTMILYPSIVWILGELL